MPALTVADDARDRKEEPKMCMHEERFSGRRAWLRTTVAGCAAAGLAPTFAYGQREKDAADKPATEAADQVIADWPKTAKLAAQTMIAKYGQPHVAHATHLYWHKTGPWNYTIVYRDPIPHLFPMKHEDVLEQAIDYRVPPGKFDELATYDGSVIVRRTKGEMSAMCDKEEMNFLALNLANDIVTGKMRVDEARQTYGKIAMAFMAGDKHAYTQGLAFTPRSGATGDADQELKK